MRVLGILVINVNMQQTRLENTRRVSTRLLMKRTLIVAPRNTNVFTFYCVVSTQPGSMRDGNIPTVLFKIIESLGSLIINYFYFH